MPAFFGKKFRSRSVKSPSRSLAVAIESLEFRTLFATIDVAAFGATTGGGDDTAAIQSAINHSTQGDTIVFHAGTYNISGEIDYAGQRSYESDGSGAAVLAAGHGDMGKITGDDIQIRGLTFDGAGLTIDKGQNVTIRGCTFQNINGGEGALGSGIFFTGLNDSSIINNEFKNIVGWGGIFGYSPVNTHVDRNSFDNVTEGIHLNQQAVNAPGDTVNYNVGNGIQRAFLEIQDTQSSDSGPRYYEGLQIIGNYNTNFRQDWAAPGADLFGCVYSIPVQWSTGTVVKNNFCDSTAGFALEVCGEDYTIEGNTFGSEISSSHFSGNLIGITGHQKNVTIQGNTLQDLGSGTLGAIWGVATGAGSISSNNTLVRTLPTVQPPQAGPSIDGNDAPASNSGSTPTTAPAGSNAPATSQPTTSVPNPSPTNPAANPVVAVPGAPSAPSASSAPASPAPVAQPARPTNLVAKATGPTSVLVTWAEGAGSQTQFEVERKAGDGPWQAIALIGADQLQYTDAAAAPSTSYAYRVRGINLTDSASPAYSQHSSNDSTRTAAAPADAGSTVASTVGGLLGQVAASV